MHALTAGRPLVRAQSLEAIKWTALVLMLVEHVFYFVLERMPVSVMLVGRSVFPLFAMALAVGVSGIPAADREAWGRLLVRLLAWGIVAAAAGSLVRDALPANVLFTLALGLFVDIAWRSGHWSRWFSVGAALLLGFAVEYGPCGVAAVALLCGWARDQGSRGGLVQLGLAIGLICVANGNIFAVFAPLIAWALDRGELAIPRVPRFFYWAYAGQWPVFALLRGLL